MRIVISKRPYTGKRREQQLLFVEYLIRLCVLEKFLGYHPRELELHLNMQGCNANANQTTDFYGN